MLVRVLGSSAGGGTPQWNCGCTNCRAAREGRAPRRLVASIAVSSGNGSWALINASADVRVQIEMFRPIQPTGLRDSPIAAVVLTDANLDHASGLLELRQAERLAVYSTPLVRTILGETNPAFAPFTRGDRRWECVAGDAFDLRDAEGTPLDLRARAVGLAGLTPSFAGGLPEPGAATAYVIEDESGASIVYAPVFGAVDEALERAVDGADAVFLDGSFWSDDEMIARGLGTRTAREMGHAPISGPGGSLAMARGLRCAHRYYTHVNNSNPILDPGSEASSALRAAGVGIAYDGFELTFGAEGQVAADAGA